MAKEEKKVMYEMRQRVLQAEPVIHNNETEEDLEVADAVAQILNEIEELKKHIK